MENLTNFNSTSKMSRTFNAHPLFNIVMLATVLSKLAYGKTYQPSPWLPFRPVFGYLPHPPYWYSVDPLLFNSKFYPPNNPTNQQQIIHIHENSDLDENDEGVEPSSGPYDLPIPNHNIDHIQTSPSNNDNKIMNITRNDENNTFSDAEISQPINDTENEILEPVYLYKKPFKHTILPIEQTTINSEMFDQETTSTEIITSQVFDTTTERIETDAITEESDFSITELSDSTTDSYNYDDYTTELQDYDTAASNIDKQTVLVKMNRKTMKPIDQIPSENVEVLTIKRVKPINSQQKTRPRPYRYQPTRINSKKDHYYDYDYDYSTQRNYRRTTGIPYRRRTTPAYDFNEYEESRPHVNRKKTNTKYGNRRTTTPAYDDYYDDVYDDNKEFYDEDYHHNNRQKFRPRQQSTTESTTTETTSDSTTTEESTTTAATTTTEPTTLTTQQQTSVGYPYYGNSGYGNISITYGPPTSGGNTNHQQGYGPSNGNEYISITYGPPTGPNISPIIDSWYNQYAKSSVIKRIQDLLTPNNFYNPQYDTEKFNYNDGVF